MVRLGGGFVAQCRRRPCQYRPQPGRFNVEPPGQELLVSIRSLVAEQLPCQPGNPAASLVPPPPAGLLLLEIGSLPRRLERLTAARALSQATGAQDLRYGFGFGVWRRGGRSPEKARRKGTGVVRHRRGDDEQAERPGARPLNGIGEHWNRMMTICRQERLLR
jgi:hypothetical protein